VPTLGWLPDFQHVHLPQMFSDEERRHRDVSFLRIAETSTRLILLSECVRRDFEAFAPRYAAKARPVRPVTRVPDVIYKKDPKSAANLYHLPDKFAYLPSQFWKHKNHFATLQAVRILKDRGVNVFVVCTGLPADYRHPDYFADVLKEVSRLGVRDNVAFLGTVPREHVFGLIRQSVCVLNPSLFEGYGLSVDEARSVGKHLLLSDIPPHREQNPPQALFFDPDDYEDQAAKLARLWREKSPGPDKDLENEARLVQPARIRAYAAAFRSVIDEVLPGAVTTY